MRAENSKNTIGGNRAGGIGRHCVVGGGDLFAQPALDGGISFLQGAQSSPYDFAGRSIGAVGHQRIDVGRLLGG